MHSRMSAKKSAGLYDGPFGPMKPYRIGDTIREGLDACKNDAEAEAYIADYVVRQPRTLLLQEVVRAEYPQFVLFMEKLLVLT